MRAIAVVLLLALASPAAAQDSDAPLVVEAGTPAPAAGVFLTTDRAGRIFKECSEAKANAADFEKALQEQPGTPLATVVIAASLGIAVGVALTFLVVRRPQ